MNRLAALFIRLVFLEEFSFLPFLGFSVAAASAKAGGGFVDWSFPATIGALCLVLELWFAFRVDPEKLLGRVAFVIADLIALALAALWIWLTHGSAWLAQFAFGLLSFGFALASLGLLLGPGSSLRFGRRRAGILARVMEERRQEGRKSLGKRRRRFVDLLFLGLVLGLAANAFFAIDRYGIVALAPTEPTPRPGYQGRSWNPADYTEETLGRIASSGEALVLPVSPDLASSEPASLETALRVFGDKGIDLYLSLGKSDAASFLVGAEGLAKWIKGKAIASVKGFAAESGGSTASADSAPAPGAGGDWVGALRRRVLAEGGQRGGGAGTADFRDVKTSLEGLGFDTRLLEGGADEGRLLPIETRGASGEKGEAPSRSWRELAKPERLGTFVVDSLLF
jgi:hypothetical protein